MARKRRNMGWWATPCYNPERISTCNTLRPTDVKTWWVNPLTEICQNGRTQQGYYILPGSPMESGEFPTNWGLLITGWDDGEDWGEETLWGLLITPFTEPGPDFAARRARAPRYLVCNADEIWECAGTNRWGGFDTGRLVGQLDKNSVPHFYAVPITKSKLSKEEWRA